MDIRPVTPLDLPGTYRVCLLTGDSGQDASGIVRDPDLLGHVYVGPYVLGQPTVGFVPSDAHGVAGYVLGAIDTRAFEAWTARAWWPALRERYPSGDDDSLDGQLIRRIHRPPIAPDVVVERFPAHLHIDLLARVRGMGLGRGLVERLLEALRERNVSGVHLEVAADNANAIAFYEHLGFRELEQGDDSLLMGRELT